jgi:Putative prokaryotic signal transducing protein
MQLHEGVVRDYPGGACAGENPHSNVANCATLEWGTRRARNEIAGRYVQGKSKISGVDRESAWGRFQNWKFVAEAGNPGDAGQPRPNPNEKLVNVFDSEDESEALVVKGLLDSADIDSDLASASLLQDAFPGMGGVVILVREEDADEARRLIAEQRRSLAERSLDEQSFAEDDVTAEIPIIEEPPPKG